MRRFDWIKLIVWVYCLSGVIQGNITIAIIYQALELNEFNPFIAGEKGICRKNKKSEQAINDAGK